MAQPQAGQIINNQAGGGIINNVGPYTTDNGPVPNENGPALEITVGEVDPDDDGGLFSDLGLSQDIFDDYLIESRYERDKHVYMAGLTSPNGLSSGGVIVSPGGVIPVGTKSTVAFFQLTAPTLLWVVDWTAARYGQQPEIPDPTSVDSRWVLLDDHYEPSMLTVAPDGVTPLYRISGTFVYGCTNPSANPVDDLSFPIPPWLQDVFDRSMPTGKLTGGLLEAGQGTALRAVPGLIV